MSGGEWRELADPSTPSTWFAAGGERVYDLVEVAGDVMKASNRGLFRSTDGGDSWTKLEYNNNNSIYRLAEGGSSSEIFAATWGAVLTTQDGGANWAAVPAPSADPELTALMYDKTTGLLFVANYRQGEPIYRSSDGGATWTPLKSPFSQVQTIVSSPHGGIYVAARGYGLFRTDDSGNTWTRVTTQGERWMSWVEAVAFDPADPKTMVLGTQGYGAYVSTDGGKTFVTLSALAGRRIWAIVRDGSRWAFATDEGVWLKTDPLIVRKRRAVR